jgi:hypothetical protein
MKKPLQLLLGFAFGILGFLICYFALFALGYGKSEQYWFWIYLFVYATVLIVPMLSRVFLSSSMPYACYCVSLFSTFLVFSYSDLEAKAGTSTFGIPQYSHFLEGIALMVKINFWGINILLSVLFTILLLHVYFEKNT